MAQLFNLSDENVSLIEDVFQDTGLHNYIDLKILGIEKSKDVIKVSKTGLIAEKLGNCPDSIVCIVNERVFDCFDNDTKRMIVDDALFSVAYDTEKDKIKIGTPQITVSISGRKKYGDKLIDALEAAALRNQQLEAEDKEKKKKRNE